jgi:general secretion pathway protein D
LKAIARLLFVLVMILNSATTLRAGTPAAIQSVVAIQAIGQSAGDAERKQSAEQWLKLSRQSLRAGDLDQASTYLERAEKLNVKFDSFMSRFSDTPEKIRRDIAAARAAGTKPATPSQRFTATRPDQPSVVPASNTSPAPRGDITADFANDTKAKAQRFLDNARNSLRQRNVNEAIAWRQKAIEMNVTFAPGEYSPADLARELQQAGVDPNRLPAASSSPLTEKPTNAAPDNAAPRGPARLPPIESARPIIGAGVNSPGAERQPALSVKQVNAKTAAIRLATQAQAALDRGDLQTAKQLADQAEALQVPDSAFAEGEIRPWEVGLRVQSAIARRTGVQPAANYELVPAVATESASTGRFPVSQGVYNPSTDGSRNVLVQNEEPTLAPAPIADAPAEPAPESAGVQLYRQGMDSLSRQDRAAALQSFHEAWKYERELPPDIRRQLRDKLSLLSQADQPTAPSGREPSPLEEVQSAQQLVYQKLYREISAEEQAARKMTANDPKGALDKMQAMRGRVNEAELDAPAKKLLLTFVDRSITQLQGYIEQNRSEIDLNEKNKRILDQIDRETNLKFETDDKVAELVNEFNKLIDEERHAEAEVIAKQVRELAPENPIAVNLVITGKLSRRVAEQARIRDAKEQGFYDALTSAEEAAIPEDDRKVVRFATNWKTLSESRLDRQRKGLRQLSPSEIQIQQSLGKQIDVRFTERPLSEVVETLSALAGINIHLDPAGLAAEGITPSTPVTLNLPQPISLKSVLMIILQPLRMGFVIDNEVLMITSEQAKDSKVFQKVYYVADLVVPIPNFVPGYDMGLPAAIREAHQALGYGGSMMQPISTAPLALAQDSTNRQIGGPSILAQYAANSKESLGTRPLNPSGLAPGSLGGAALADFDTLMELIQSTIAPDTWADAGGSGAIEPFPTNLSLVVSQTQDVHDQLADLLEQLRRLQDLQVAIEVRFIRLSDNFFERIGVDFDVELDDNVLQLRRDDSGPSQAFGIGPTGQPTPDRDIPFQTGSGPGNGSFSLATPTFGGFGTGAGALNVGVAILSDIEAFFLLQAATGDSRQNVMQAPKVTLFNGQAASVADSAQRPFVTSLIPVVGDFAAAHQPVITVLNEGTQLGVQAVVSSDRRFVRLTLVPFFSQIGDVQEFTFTGSQTTDTGTNVVDANGDPTGERNNSTAGRTGTTVQLPTFAFTTVSTTVSVPDGGTVLLGGIKRLQEGRNEQGVPMLSKLPYVNRLFKNVGIGRETSSLMLMVTPRIVIQEEEEEKLGIAATP